MLALSLQARDFMIVIRWQVVMGRMTQDNVVDIDLGKEGRANKVSRQQVQAGKL